MARALAPLLALLAAAIAAGATEAREGELVLGDRGFGHYSVYILLE
jgi:hypothetical protein